MSMALTVTNKGFVLLTPIGILYPGLAMRLPEDRTECEHCGSGWLLYRLNDEDGDLIKVLCHECYMNSAAYELPDVGGSEGGPE